MRKTAYLAFGANIGNGEKAIRTAWDALSRVPGVFPERLSEMYITKPWGYADQPDFTNACGRIETVLSPEALLGVCLGVEAGMGRVRTIKNGPRVIDIDLLLYGDETRDTPELVLPHPRMWERTFVLEPLLDVCGSDPALKRKTETALRKPVGDLSENQGTEDTPGGVLKNRKKV